MENRDVLEKLEGMASIQNQAKEVRLQNKLGKQNFQENIKNVFEPVTDSIEKLLKI